jgi:hypothetical protein
MLPFAPILCYLDSTSQAWEEGTLPELKDFPEEFGGSGEVVPE